jgi:hypothetical protein
MSWGGLSDAGNHLVRMQRLTARLYQVHTATTKDAGWTNAHGNAAADDRPANK